MGTVMITSTRIYSCVLRPPPCTFACFITPIEITLHIYIYRCMNVCMLDLVAVVVVVVVAASPSDARCAIIEPVVLEGGGGAAIASRGLSG